MTKRITLSEKPKRIANAGTAARVHPHDATICIGWGDEAPEFHEWLEEGDTLVTTGHEGDLWAWADDGDAVVAVTVYVAPDAAQGEMDGKGVDVGVLIGG